MVLYQQCVQSSQFDSQLVNALCSDLSVLCVCVCVQNNCMMKIPLSHHLFQALRSAEAALEQSKGPHCFFHLQYHTITALIVRIYL